MICSFAFLSIEMQLSQKTEVECASAFYSNGPFSFDRLWLNRYISSSFTAIWNDGSTSDSTHGHLLTFMSLKPRLTKLLTQALEAENDPLNTQMLLGGKISFTPCEIYLLVCLTIYLKCACLGRGEGDRTLLSRPCLPAGCF